MIISSTTISPLSLKRSGDGVPPLISTMKHEWYFNNVQNASGNIITIPDTGTVGGLDLSNTALANKPTQSSIGSKISEAADGVDDYLYKATTNFMKSMTTWMVTFVFKYDNSGNNVFLSVANETNTKIEGITFQHITAGGGSLRTNIWDGSGTLTIPMVHALPLTNGNDYIITYAWDGTNLKAFNETTQIFSTVTPNPFSIPATTHNVSVMSRIAPNASNYFGYGNIGYIGIDEIDLTRLNANVATLKTTFGI